MKLNQGVIILLVALALVVNGMVISITGSKSAGIVLIGVGFVLYLVGKSQMKQ